MKVKYLINTESEILAFEDFEEFESEVEKLMRKKVYAEAWLNPAAFLQKLRDVYSEKQRVVETLSASVNFRAKLKRNGAFTDGTPRLSISLPAKVSRESYLDPHQRWDVFIVPAGSFDELLIADESDR